MHTLGKLLFGGATTLCATILGVHQMSPDSRTIIRDKLTGHRIKLWDNHWDCDDYPADICNSHPTSLQHTESYDKLIIFIRHGQYNVRGKCSEEKVLTELGWKQAYEAGRRLRNLGYNIDRIIHSDMIRARQTTAALLAGLQDDPDHLFDTNLLANLATPAACPERGGDYSYSYSHACTQQDIEDVKKRIARKISPPYRPYSSAGFECQESNLLAEGPPPIAPEPRNRSSTSDIERLKLGRRIEDGFRSHIHRFPVTTVGQHALLPSHSMCKQSPSPNGKDTSPTSTVCHRLTEGKPCETLVFVGHANVFRYWLMRVLQFPPEAWLRLSLYHGSITTVQIRHEAVCDYDLHSTRDLDSTLEHTPLPGCCFVTVGRIGDAGHLPRELLSR